MIDVPVLRPLPEVHGEERETQSLVLRDVTELVSPHRFAGFGCRDDDVPEGDRPEAALGEDQVREATVAHVEEAPIPPARERSRKDAKQVPDGVRVMRGERATKLQGIDATTSSTAASTRSAVVMLGSKRSMI